MRLDAEQADRRVGRQGLRQRIAGRGQGVDSQHAAGRANARSPAGAASTLAHGCAAASRLPTTRNGSWAKKLPVLVGHVVADHARAEGLHALAHASERLHRAFARVQGGERWHSCRQPDGATAAIGTKPGSASIRASQARTCG